MHHSTADPSVSSSQALPSWMVMIGILAIALAIRLAFFIGFTGSDDAH